MTTKSQEHNYKKYNEHLNSDSYAKPKIEEQKKTKPTLQSCNGNIKLFRQEIKKFYKDRLNDS